MIQHVTVHLADSLPRKAIERIELSLSGLDQDQRSVERRKRLHEWIDAGHGRCVLGEPGVAEMVQNAFLHFEGIRYQLHAWVVMPNHIHVLFEPLADWALAKIVASWKKFTARRIRDFLRATDTADGVANGFANREIGGPGKPGPVWRREYWDRYIRDERHYRQTVEYIHNNPVAAGLAPCPEAWRWSSIGGVKT